MQSGATVRTRNSQIIRTRSTANRIPQSASRIDCLENILTSPSHHSIPAFFHTSILPYFHSSNKKEKAADGGGHRLRLSGFTIRVRYPVVMLIVFLFGCASGRFGSVTVNTPFLKAAFAFAASTSAGSGTTRRKLP